MNMPRESVEPCPCECSAGSAPVAPGTKRRTLFAAAGAGAIAAGVAACSSGGVSGGADPSSAGGSGDSKDSTSLSKITENSSALVFLGGKQLLITRGSGTEVSAVSALCTHKQCPVNVQKEQAVCPCHGSVFNAKTGAVINGPALTPLPPVNVTVTGDTITLA